MSRKRLMQLVGIVGGLGLLACSPITDPLYQSDDGTFVIPIEVVQDTTLLSEAWSGR